MRCTHEYEINNRNLEREHVAKILSKNGDLEKKPKKRISRVKG